MMTSPKDRRWQHVILVLFLIAITRINFLPDVNFPAWLLADAAAFLYILKNHHAFLATLNRNKLLFTVPVLALMSSFWSFTPLSTAYHALQFVLLILVACAFFPNFGLLNLLKCIFVYNFMVQFGSLYVYVIGGNWPEGFPGAYLHKNLLGMFSTLQIITGFILFLNGWQRLLCLLSMALAVLLLILSSSGTSLVLTVVIWALFPFARTVQKGMSYTMIVTGLCLSLAAMGGLVWISGSQIEVVDSILALLGKDATLTGRSVLWDYAKLAIPQNPVLGMGFLAYWDSPMTTAAGLQYEMQQELRMFHNVYIEITVALGFVGASLFVATFAQQIYRAILFFVGQQNFLSAFPFVFLVWVSMLSMSENPVFGVLPMQFLLATIVVASFARPPARAS